MIPFHKHHITIIKAIIRLLFGHQVYHLVTLNRFRTRHRPCRANLHRWSYSIRSEVVSPKQLLQSFNEAEYDALSRLNMTADTILAKWHKLTKQVKPRHHTVEMYALVSLWPWSLTLTLKTFSAMPTYVTIISAKFHWNPFTKYKDIASGEIGLTDGRTTHGRRDDRPT